MKKTGSLLIAAFLGSAISLTGFYFINKSNTPTIRVEHENKIEAKPAAYQKQAAMISLNFTEAAGAVMPAAVHIKSSQTVRHSSSNGVNPFQYYFGDELFEHFFGPSQPQQKTPEVRVATGSGVIIKDNGYIVTNNHVVAEADDIEVTLNDNRTFKATVVGTDPSTDLALLKIDEENLPFINFANSDDVLVGEWVLAVGNPFNLNSTVTAGIVSAKARNINILQDKYAIESFIQTDAAINPGNSGGALVNLNGELVGINTAIASPTGSYSGYGFAVPSNIVKKVIYDLETFGTVQRGFIGVMIRSVDASLADEKDLDVSEGVYVDSLVDDGAAEEAGIKPGDVILSVDGTDVKTSPELQEIIGRHKPGDVISVNVDRKGKQKIFNVTLKNKNGNASIVKVDDSEILSDLGIEITEPDKKVMKQLELNAGVQVKNIRVGKISKHTDMRKGFIITKVDNTPINDTEQFKEVMSKKKGGVLIEGVYPDYPGEFYYAFGM